MLSIPFQSSGKDERFKGGNCNHCIAYRLLELLRFAGQDRAKPRSLDRSTRFSAIDILQKQSKKHSQQTSLVGVFDVSLRIDDQALGVLLESSSGNRGKS